MISPGKAFPCTSISVRLYHILKHQESTASFEYYFQSMWKCEFFILSQKTYLKSSVADPDPSDPYAFWTSWIRIHTKMSWIRNTGAKVKLPRSHMFFLYVTNM